MEAAHAERSKLVQRQKQQRQELEKKIKKLKGAMKEAAQKELDELEEKHEAELAEFDGSKGVAGAASASKEEPEEKAISAEDAKKFRERNWSGLSKKELEEECVLRGLGKKGSKEDLIQKLIIFQQELKSKTAAGGYAASSAPQAPDKEDDDDEDDEEDEEDEDSEDEDDDDEDEQQEVDAEEMERQGKREKAVQKALRFLLKEKCPDGFALAELVEKLEMVNVKGFATEKLGYKTIEKFVRGQPEAVLRYRRKEQQILPPTK
eukprot:TRINITY_DN7747_c0_g1_i1.p1 TRINITY_DN7747_c0_g1~~TRINITY_DN7747_c0_g1_i1.p1  ORF type:complete len:263 (-),score=120.30 TRINITY_DN7747_c0_g1_i1:10-798(-)